MYLHNEISYIKEVVVEAGALLQKLKSNVKSTQKKDLSIVTAADLACDEFLKKELSRLDSEIGWLSEETLDASDRHSKVYTWVVDPLDGTKEYVQNIPEYAVSVALVEQGCPILALVYNPQTSELFHAIKGQGAWLNDAPISCNTIEPLKPSILTSCTEYSKGSFDFLKSDFNIKPTGSIAYRLGLVASGMADATYTVNNRSEWDVAAGVLLIQEAGGIVHDFAFKPFIFNQQAPLVNGVLASSKAVYHKIKDKIS